MTAKNQKITVSKKMENSRRLALKAKTARIIRINNIAGIVFTTVLGAAMLSGCAAPPVVRPAAVFFPLPPDEPRIQFLKTVSGSYDVEGEGKKGFMSLLDEDEDRGKPITKPYGMQYVGGKLYVCDSQGFPSIIIIDFVKKSFNYLAGNNGAGRLRKPLNVAVDKDGNVFVADMLKQEILTYDQAGRYTGSIGKGTDLKPADVAVDAKAVYVLDSKANAIKVFDRQSRELLRSFGNPADHPAKEGLFMPTNFAADDKGLIYVTNAGLGNVMILDKDGHIIGKFGRMGDSYGEFARPKGIAVDSHQRIWVVDAAFQNVQIFDDQYRLLLHFGAPPLPAGALNVPASITTTTENLDYFQTLADPDFVLDQVIFVANQAGNHKISLYGLGHQKAPAAASASEGKQTTVGNPGAPGRRSE